MTSSSNAIFYFRVFFFSIFIIIHFENYFFHRCAFFICLSWFSAHLVISGVSAAYGRREIVLSPFLGKDVFSWSSPNAFSFYFRQLNSNKAAIYSLRFWEIQEDLKVSQSTSPDTASDRSVDHYHPVR